MPLAQQQRSLLTSAVAVATALRPYQWVKNSLLVVPMLLAHEVADLSLWVSVVVAVAAFSLCASSAYVVNDILDREADRGHPVKRHRPFAAGELPVGAGIVMAPLLLAAGVALGWLLLPRAFLITLAVYVVITLAYSVALKRFPIVDVLVLAGLYTLRILAGGAATEIPVSHWLLAFAVFFFLSLALLKRYAELRLLELSPGQSLAGRGYASEDLALLRTTGPSAGFISVLVLALYVTSPEVLALYTQPALLWIAGGLLLYWILRIWMKAHRGEVHDDPVLFAAKDQVSYLVGALTAATLVAATL